MNGYFHHFQPWASPLLFTKGVAPQKISRAQYIQLQSIPIIFAEIPHVINPQVHYKQRKNRTSQYIWVNYYNSLTWILRPYFRGWFPLHSPFRLPREVVKFTQIYSHRFIIIYPTINHRLSIDLPYIYPDISTSIPDYPHSKSAPGHWPPSSRRWLPIWCCTWQSSRSNKGPLKSTLYQFLGFKKRKRICCIYIYL